MPTEKVTHSVLVVASEEVGQAAEKAFAAAGALHCKAVAGARPALAAIGTVKPHFLVIEAGRLPVPGMQAVKNMAELAASRPVPLIMVCGPLDATVEKMRTSLGIAHVLNSPFEAKAVVEFVKATIEKAQSVRRESEERKVKQMQIRQRLKSASDKYATMTEEAARMKLNPPPEPEPEVEPVSDDDGPAIDPDPAKPPDKPTWDGG
jgi:DNA-binding NtrC family response regulator